MTDGLLAFWEIRVAFLICSQGPQCPGKGLVSLPFLHSTLEIFIQQEADLTWKQLPRLHLGNQIFL